MDDYPAVLARIHAVTGYLNCMIARALLRTNGAYITDIAGELGYDKYLIRRRLREFSDNGLAVTYYNKADRCDMIDRTYAEPTDELYGLAWVLARPRQSQPPSLT